MSFLTQRVLVSFNDIRTTTHHMEIDGLRGRCRILIGKIIWDTFFI